ncbi:MAG: cyclic pyranopterin monophosphate synthase MoaC [Pseudomonadota bacterium]
MDKRDTLTHVDASGTPRMVDVGDKTVTRRVARAQARVVLPLNVRDVFRDGDVVTKKGPVVHTAIIAGTQAVKKTAELIPFCHPLPIERCRFDTTLTDDALVIECEVAVSAKTGVEMEALTGVNVAALTVYDMLKALSHDITITDVALLHKRGGKSDVDREPGS